MRIYTSSDYNGAHQIVGKSKQTNTRSSHVLFITLALENTNSKMYLRSDEKMTANVNCIMSVSCCRT